MELNFFIFSVCVCVHYNYIYLFLKLKKEQIIIKNGDLKAYRNEEKILVFFFFFSLNKTINSILLRPNSI
jgi:hypothetical protein